MDIFIKNNQLILYIAVAFALVVLIFALLKMRSAIKKRKSAMATTALMKKQMGRQSASTGGMQFELRASEYGIDETLAEMKKNLNRINAQKNEIIVLVDELKEKIAQKDLKPEQIKIFIEDIKIKTVEIEAKTNQLCAPQNIQRFEEELPKITTAARIMHAKDKGQTKTNDVPLLMKSVDHDKKQFIALIALIRELPKEIKSFISFIETQLKAIERKFAGFFMKKLEGVPAHDKKATEAFHKHEEKNRHAEDTSHKHAPEKNRHAEKEIKPDKTQNHHPSFKPK